MTRHDLAAAILSAHHDVEWVDVTADPQRAPGTIRVYVRPRLPARRPDETLRRVCDTIEECCSVGVVATLVEGHERWVREPAAVPPLADFAQAVALTAALAVGPLTVRWGDDGALLAVRADSPAVREALRPAFRVTAYSADRADWMLP